MFTANPDDPRKRTYHPVVAARKNLVAFLDSVLDTYLADILAFGAQFESHLVFDEADEKNCVLGAFNPCCPNNEVID